ncbi:MAG: hypothetical protein GY807_21140 [Gammaproteobacteria bacterium]|nr:hypothetical protein [Gammaproteobacteria bacterium]
MNALNSRTIKTILIAAFGYAMTKYAIPEQFASHTVKSAIADIIVYTGFGIAAWYRKNARTDIQNWWSK